MAVSIRQREEIENTKTSALEAIASAMELLGGITKGTIRPSGTVKQGFYTMHQKEIAEAVLASSGAVLAGIAELERNAGIAEDS